MKLSQFQDSFLFLAILPLSLIAMAMDADLRKSIKTPVDRQILMMATVLHGAIGMTALGIGFLFGETPGKLCYLVGLLIGTGVMEAGAKKIEEYHEKD